MSYKPIHTWKRKDSLPSKDAQKIIYGTHLQDEFDAISVTFDEVQGGFDEVKDKLESGGYSVEEAPADGDQYGRQQKNGKMAWTKIDSVGSVTWSEISDKPSTYPPSAHNHDGEYLKTETDPVFTSSVAFGITQDDIDSWNAGGGGGSSDSGPPVHIGDTAPPDPSEGDLWYDTSSDTLFLFDGTEWFSTESCGSGGDSGGGSGGGSVEAIASGTLATGDAVIVNADGTVSVIVGTPTPADLSDPTVFFTDGIDEPIAAYDPTYNVVLVVFAASPNDNAAMVVGTIDGDTITFGEVKQIEGSGATYSTIGLCNAGAGCYVIAYAKPTKYGYASIVTVDAGSISIGAEVNFETTGGAQYIQLAYDLESGKVLCIYRKPNELRVGVGKVFTLDKLNKTISVGTEKSLASDFGTPTLSYDPVQKKFICAYKGASSYPTVAVYEIDSGNQIEKSTEVIINSKTGSWIDSVYEPISRRHVIVLCNEGDPNNAGSSTTVAIKDGSREIEPITGEEWSAINATYSTRLFVSYDPVKKKVFVTYQDESNSKLLTTAYGEVSNKKCNWETPAATTQVGSDVVSHVDPDSGSVWIIGKDQAGVNGSAWRYVPGYIASTLTSTNYIGISSADYANGDTATIQTIGSVSKDQSGLTAGLGYYVQPDGSLGTSGDVFAGTAISPTSLIVKG